jgi:hypothetical protein
MDRGYGFPRLVATDVERPPIAVLGGVALLQPGKDGPLPLGAQEGQRFYDGGSGVGAQ